MPAFSKPISSRVLPRYWVWSMSTLVTMAQSVSITLVASRRPPSPTSRMIASRPEAAKKWMMASVVNSKYVRLTGSAKLLRARSTASKCGSSCASVAISPFRRARSLNEIRCGEVWQPTL
ncbi:hypothetical protein D3C81_1498930 [compost metagenome]